VNKSIIFVVLLVTACAGGGDRPSTIRVLTYNIHAGKDARLVDNLERIVAVIDSSDADVVLLQEVDRRTRRADGADHYATLQRLTRMHGVFGKSLDFQGGEYGIAVLSRWPLDSISALPLKVDPPQERSGASYEPRIALHVRIHSPSGPVDVINTHLDPGAAGLYRRQELVAVLAHMKQKTTPGIPLLFGGDLNARPNTDDIMAVSFVLTDAFGSCGTGAGETFPSHAPDRRIDYIFLQRARCSSARVLETQASDHRPMLAIIEIAGEK
jgi:endonuclease/exonuclease/phosphatase family metal-dependent hydrolase